MRFKNYTNFYGLPLSKRYYTCYFEFFPHILSQKISLDSDFLVY